MRSNTGRIIAQCGGLLAVGLGALVGAGALYQTAAERRDARLYPPLGRRIDMGGYHLHIQCMGTGSPTVVLDCGLNMTMLDWSYVQPLVSGLTRVCMYDRAGHGWSDPGRGPRTSRRIAHELHTLLVRTGMTPPYILVGHSSGGLNVRVYAALYPDEVAGMVLVDAAHEDQRARMPHRALSARLADWVDWQVYRLNPILARVGVLRARRQPNGVIAALPPNKHGMAIAIGLRSYAYDWIWTEAAALKESEAQARCAGSLGHRPLAVISAHVQSAPRGMIVEQVDRLWMEMQKDLAALSSRSRHIVTDRSGHFIHLDQPDIVLDAIRWVIEEVRREGKNAQ